MIYFKNKLFKDVHIEPTNVCNFSCWMCPREIMTRKQGYLDFNSFKNLINCLRESNIISHIHFGGFGEPTLHKNIIDMINYIKKETSFTVSMTTNGWKFARDEKFIKNLILSEIDILYISLRHTVNDKIHKSIPETTNFNTYINGILNLIQFHQNMKSKTQLNISFLKDTFYSQYILNVKNDAYIDKIFLNSFIKDVSTLLNKNIPSYDSYTKTFTSKITRINIINVGNNLFFRFDGLGAWTTAFHKYKNKEKCLMSNYGSCTGLENHFSITWEGEVISCCGDFDAKNKLGNIFADGDIIKILSSKKSIKFAESLRHNKMPSETCRICRGGITKKEKLGNIIGTFIASKANLFLRK